MPLRICYACNDWRNGTDLGKSEMIEFCYGDETVTLAGGSVVTRYADGRLQVGRVFVPTLSQCTWDGNWCWDSARVHLAPARTVWNYLAAKKDWHCEEGPEALYDAFNAHRKLSADEWSLIWRSLAT